MKKLLLPVLIISIYFAFSEQQKSHPNLLVMIPSIVIFIYAMSQLMSKVPSKNPEDKNGIL